MSSFFINRPIFSAVISIIIVIAGLVASSNLPISQYPEITPPTVNVTASYPGASAETLAKTVAAPIEEQLSGIEGLIYYNSQSSSNGQLDITATFAVGTDPKQATIDVNNQMRQADPRLPEDVRRNGVVVERRSTSFLQVVSLTSPKGTHDTLFMSNYATINILDELKRVPGVGDVIVFGARDYSMRIWLRPDRMAQLGVTTSDVMAAINAQNFQYAAGKIGQEPAPEGQVLTYSVIAQGRLAEPEQFGEIIIRAGGAQGMLQLKDIARVELGAQSYDSFATLDGNPAVNIGIFLQTGANALAVAEAVNAKLDELADRFPQDMIYSVPFDTTRFVNASIEEVTHTLIEAAILVLVVVFIFLQSWRATIIPMLAVPVSLIGAFAGLWLFGFSINTLTMFAMVLAIGIVVDDAIVVLENVERLMREQKLPAKEAAIEAMKEVSGAIVAIVLVLLAVFVPVAFLGGIAGQLYQQFAVTLAVAVVISGIVALTLTPAMCALLLKESHHESRLFRPFNRAFERLTRFYTATVGRVIRYSLISLLIFVLVIGLAWWLLQRVPTSFVPEEDQGYLISSIMLPDGATLQRTNQTATEYQQALASNSNIANVVAISGFDLIGGGSKTNAGTVFLPLTPWDERESIAQELVEPLMGLGMSFEDGMVLTFNPPPIQGLGTAGGFELYVQDRSGGDIQALYNVVQQFMAALSEQPRLTEINSFFRPTVPQLYIEVDEAKALSMGVPVTEVYNTLQSTMGALYVNDFNRAGRTFRVQLQAEPEFRSRPEDLSKVYVRSASGEMIPLGSLLRIQPMIGAEQLERFNGFPAAKVMGNGQVGVSSGEAIRLVEEVAAEVLPDGYTIAWTGQAFQEKQTGSSSVLAFVFAIIMVFLILSALYERWSLPLAVITAVPFALLGALLGLLIRDMPNDIYFQIGLIVLIGLAAKNAILIVEFAAQIWAEGKSRREAALEAARLRFRPIIMTSLAFILGVLPLALATGAGASARQSMGTGVVFGMLAATFIATLFVPMFFTRLLREGKQRREAGAVEVVSGQDQSQQPPEQK